MPTMQDRIEMDTRSVLQTDRQFPSVSSQKKGIEINKPEERLRVAMARQ
jgi:hypothetical protein